MNEEVNKFDAFMAQRKTIEHPTARRIELFFDKNNHRMAGMWLDPNTAFQDGRTWVNSFDLHGLSFWFICYTNDEHISRVDCIAFMLRYTLGELIDLQVNLTELTAIRRRASIPLQSEEGDGLFLCRICGDYETTNPGRVCDHCTKQRYIDENC